METAVGMVRWERDFARAVERTRDERRELLVYFHKPN
jgi:hypothetical protein